jgi:hypothetical protein
VAVDVGDDGLAEGFLVIGAADFLGRGAGDAEDVVGSDGAALGVVGGEGLAGGVAGVVDDEEVGGEGVGLAFGEDEVEAGGRVERFGEVERGGLRGGGGFLGVEGEGVGGRGVEIGAVGVESGVGRG